MLVYKVLVLDLLLLLLHSFILGRWMRLRYQKQGLKSQPSTGRPWYTQEIGCIDTHQELLCIILFIQQNKLTFSSNMQRDGLKALPSEPENVNLFAKFCRSIQVKMGH